ncbi:hypothetical protein HDU67_006832 [Dinochytrium kinnereticum]|nr:hypothetical protein HDU67_006832 [Dinochytrium kinnereticum]
MSSQSCGKCEKTVYATEKVEAASKWYHKGCFKCADTTCNIQLNLKTFKAANGAIYCDKHVPKHKAAQIADSVSIQHAINAPKKSNEGLHKVLVGTGETPTYGLDTISTQHAVNAPKKSNEGLHKVQVGTGETPTYGLSSISTQHALNAPKSAAENLGFVQRGDKITPKNGLGSNSDLSSPTKPEHYHQAVEIEA